MITFYYYSLMFRKFYNLLIFKTSPLFTYSLSRLPPRGGISKYWKFNKF